MKNITKLSDFLLEKKIVLKRKYTENYPAKNVSTSAKVRNHVFNAIGDAVITEEEFQRILAEVNANKRWAARNGRLFSIKEEESVRKISLSDYGKKIYNVTKHVNESKTSKDVIQKANHIPKFSDFKIS
jgi:hypothetical protein